MDSAAPTHPPHGETDAVAGGEHAPATIVLVNLMAGEARAHTERQFHAILGAASADSVRLACISPRTGESIVARVEVARPDGLIVTGMPPRAAHLRDEPLWPTLAGLVDYAVGEAIPTVWSCLAAHAAVLHLDGIERRRLPEKLVGLVACGQTGGAHAALAGLPARWQVPHSRYNEVPGDALTARGYRILSCAEDGGVDLFAKQAGAPFLFCQGHPEYDAQALLLEFRRDVGQFLAGERRDYPAIPVNLFPAEVAALLDAFRARAERDRHTGLMAAFPMAPCAASLRHGWRDFTVALYRNWLAHVVGRRPDTVAARAPAARETILGDSY
jgi:homoserine O-succinyltransferase/O-acetyltransferase